MPTTETFQQIRMALEAEPPRSGMWFTGPKDGRYYVTKSADTYICGGAFYFNAADMAYKLCRAMAQEAA